MNGPFLKTIALAVVFFPSVAMSADVSKKLIVIGMDGLDPVLLERYMNEGLLPHFKALASKGSFKRLETSNPPQSPVAWSCFITGCNPGCHDVFDFIVRNPSTYTPEIGMTETKKSDGKRLGELMAGLSGPGLQTRRKGKSFWDILSDNKIKSTILRCPVTFPAEPLNGRLLSGMGTPDIRGTQGVFSYFTETALSKPKDVHGRVVRVARQGNVVKTELTGPRLKSSSGTSDVMVPIEITILSKSLIRISIQSRSEEVAVSRWSPWFHVKFKTGFLQEIMGTCRFFVEAVDPELAVYASPVNIDPKKPAMTISYPSDYAKELFEKIGDYHTQGMPYDTWALNEGRLSETQFLDQAYTILEENRKTLDVELARFDQGFLFCYFGITDLIQHMFWRYEDPTHPNRGANADPNVRNAIKNIYVKMDELLGEIEAKRGRNANLIVLSDHGFGSFRRAAHVNSWLLDHGYLVLLNGAKESAEMFQTVDWSETRAYSLGFGGIYINQFGREKNGVVYKGAETDQLKKQLAADLLQWKDKNGTAIIKKIYDGDELYKGPYAANAPDLYIGFNLPYRASWQTGLGGAPLHLVDDNMKMWSGDHLCDPTLVPGVFLSDFPIRSDRPRLIDLAPTILRYFGIGEDASIEGHAVQ